MLHIHFLIKVVQCYNLYYKFNVPIHFVSRINDLFVTQNYIPLINEKRNCSTTVLNNKQKFKQQLIQIHRFQLVITLYFYQFQMKLRGCGSGCNIEGDRKDIKLKLLAFEILKPSGLSLSKRLAGHMLITFNLKECTLIKLNYVRFCFLIEKSVKKTLFFLTKKYCARNIGSNL